ncbi:MAG: zinc metalloprotease HtpX [Acidobacteriota bacterium]
MNQDRLWDHRLRNLIHSTLLLTGMVALLWSIASIFFERPGVLLTILAGLALLTLGGISPRLVLRMHRASPLDPYSAPELFRLVRQLAGRSGLRHPPTLYLVPSRALNAFAVGHREESAIGITQGLLQRLDRRELAGVLAHEISHIKNRDLWVMGLARWLGQMTGSLSWVGQLMLLFMLLIGYPVPWAAILLLIAAPTLSALLQMALSRTREFEADLGAARLTEDPMGLASALSRLEAQQGGWWRWLIPVPRRTRSSFLDSHPATAERVERLRSLVQQPTARPARPAHRAQRPVARQAAVRVPVRLIDHGPAPWPPRPYRGRRPAARPLFVSF